MIQARAAVAAGDGTYGIENVSLDAPGPGEVLIEVRASGICHTDWDSLQWRRPLILGHEGAGQVLAIGADVTTCAQGDNVMLNWAIPCGRCFQCANDRQNICEQRGRVPDGRFHRESLSQDHTGPALNTGGTGPGGFNASFSLGTMATHGPCSAGSGAAFGGGSPF